MKPLVFKLTTVGAAAGRGRQPQAETAESEKFFFVCVFYFEVPNNYRTVFASKPAPLLFDNKVSHLVGSY